MCYEGTHCLVSIADKVDFKPTLVTKDKGDGFSVVSMGTDLGGDKY